MPHLRTILSAMLILFVSGKVCGEASLYRSNSLGMALQRLESRRLSGQGYELRVEEERGRESLWLFLDGKEIERWERLLSPDGRLLEEKHFTLTADGDAMQYREEYAYSPAGRLREITRVYPEGAVHVYSYGFADNRLVEERIQQDQELFVSRYDDQGRLLEWATYRDETLMQKSAWEYYDDRGVPRSLQVMDLAADITTYAQFDEEGRVLMEEQTGSVAEQTLYQRNGDGELLAKVKNGDKGREEWRYFYRNDGEVEKEEYYLKGALERSRVYTASDMWYEELYRSGEVFLRITYQEGEKVKEEFISEGEVVRERRYP